MNKLSSYELCNMADMILKCYEENGKQFVKILKDRFGYLRTFEILNPDLNDNTLMLKEFIGEDV